MNWYDTAWSDVETRAVHCFIYNARGPIHDIMSQFSYAFNMAYWADEQARLWIADYE
jgi:hypothetical protein